MFRQAHVGRTPSTSLVPADEVIDDGHHSKQAIPSGERACCCAAPAGVRVLLLRRLPYPHSVDLLLCRHHYRASSVELGRRGAMAFDRDGSLLGPDRASGAEFVTGSAERVAAVT